MAFASGADDMEPNDVVWHKFTVRRAFPISTILSASIHVGFLIVVISGVVSWLTNDRDEPIEFEPVVIYAPRGGGADGSEDQTSLGSATTWTDPFQAIEPSQRPTPRVTAQPEIVPMVAQQTDTSVEIPDTDLTSPRLKNLAPRPNLLTLVGGLPDALKGKGGRAVGHGDGKGRGDGNGEGDGPGGRLTVKQKRQLRWHLLFNISNAADYLDQLRRMKAIIGFQFPDRSIHLIADLQKRPAPLQRVAQVPDRIFWMDDDPDSVRSICDELRVTPLPQRVVAFFPEAIEEELLRKERSYGQRFGRTHEDDFVETVFRVTNDYGRIDITVVRQVGR